ncbi:unnamed protein product [Polarella glacialis]|uniref:Uncharacterized protein n=1 Tax=Polarella glacialis TaxID=89957 RepID=A0A813FW11_POLGL|nr:unnamed protein product [Polarella glacialis]
MPNYKWSGIAALGNKLYAAPHSSNHLLIYDIGTGKVSGVSTTAVETGRYLKWSGIVALGDKVYAAPYGADHLLIYASSTEHCSLELALPRPLPQPRLRSPSCAQHGKLFACTAKATDTATAPAGRERLLDPHLQRPN